MPHHQCCRVLLLILTVTLIHNARAACNGQISTDAIWARACDSSGNDIGSAKCEACSGAFYKNRDCSHFSWARFDDRTCPIKGGRITEKNKAIVNPRPASVCGVPRARPDSLNLNDARLYLPTFRFDDASGNYCFPDDKQAKPSRDNTCASFSRSAPVYAHAKTCGEYTVYQYSLWYGLQKECFNLTSMVGFGKHGDDNEYVQVWVKGKTGPVAKVRYNQHNGFYFRDAGKGAEVQGKRAVVHIGKVAHGAYHRGCTGGSFWNAFKPSSGTEFCAGGCGYWDDFRNSRKSKYVLDNGKLHEDPSPRDIDCDAPSCDSRHSSWRSPMSASCFGLGI